MSILPYFLDDFDLRPAKRPRKLGWLNNLLTDEFVQPSMSMIPRNVFDVSDYVKNLSAALIDKDPKIKVDKNKFYVNFDVQHFKPDEICVKINEDNRTITIEAEHEEKQDEHGQVYRHFLRKYTLPEDCNINQVESKLSSDGVLSISAPRKDRKRKLEEHRSIPIIQTGQPAKSIENKPENNEKMDTR